MIKLKSVITKYTEKSINFDYRFNLNDNENFYCSEFVAKTLNELNGFQYKSIKKESNKLLKSIIKADVFEYFPVDFFLQNPNITKIYEKKFQYNTSKKMKTFKILIIVALFPVGLFAQKFSAGASAGLITVDKNNGFNGNLYAGWHLNDKISLGADALLSERGLDFKTNAYMVYVEAGNPTWSLDNKNIVYFSGMLGLGYVEENVKPYKEGAFSFYAGTKINLNINPKFIFGIKSGIYFSKLDDDPIIANLFFTYRF
ncbi:MAG: hypothetical protein QM642_02500 [Edaphocola sp.]